ncbi:MAG: alpha/beta fold hydrolase, partial [Rhodospirillales bacterium]|nr:alpha/beta fold hydrolase [Rhodospirillales bacterium]
MVSKNSFAVAPSGVPKSSPKTSAPSLGRHTKASRLHAGALPGIADLDHLLHALQAPAVEGISPAAVMNARFDWLVHISNSPTKQMNLAQKMVADWMQLAIYAGRSLFDGETPPPAQVDRRDRRFRSNEWQIWPFNIMAQSFLLTQNWWNDAMSDVRGVTKQHERELQFMARQHLDSIAPANFPWTNPEVIARTREESGMNLVHGADNLINEMQRRWTGEKPKGLGPYQIGHDIAITPGKVVYRNRLIELIQYAPATDEVWREPLLIVPAWIMKYYVLDLSPGNSLVKYLVGQGHTVFMISWRNPSAEYRDLGMEDYRCLGIMAALDAIGKVLPKRRVHACGYCLGGTLLAITAAAMVRDGDQRLASVSLLAAQTDFTEAGELMLFIDESQLAYLEDLMWAKGYLDTKEMSSAFQLLRAADLIWSRLIREYLLGEEETYNDLMAWNADQTRLPYKMHSEYLRQLFLENRLSAGKYEVDGKPVSLTDIDTEIFAVGTIRDHIAPWQSVFKIKILTDTDVTFVLAAGGHNAGIVSEPGHPNRSYQLMQLKEEDSYKDPEAWRQQAPQYSGSWWPAWSQWLAERSTDKVKPPPTGAPKHGLKALD